MIIDDNTPVVYIFLNRELMSITMFIWNKLVYKTSKLICYINYFDEIFKKLSNYFPFIKKFSW